MTKALHQQKCQKGKVTTQTTPQKSSITQRLRTDLGRSVGVKTTPTSVVNRFTGPNPKKVAIGIDAGNSLTYLVSIQALNRILSVFTGHMNCIGKKSKLNATRMRCMKICVSFRCNLYVPWTPTKCDYILIFTTSFYNKVCRRFAYLNTKMSNLSDFKRTKIKTLRTASTGRMTNWTKPPCDPVQMIRTQDWYL